jgi:hypothetical protein
MVVSNYICFHFVSSAVPYVDSSDDDLSSYRSALAAGFFRDVEPSNGTTLVDGGLPSDPSSLNSWASFPSAQFSALGRSTQPGVSSQSVGSGDDLPDVGTPHALPASHLGVGLDYLERGNVSI